MISSWRADQRGATAIEFAILAVPFFGLVFLIIQIGFFHFGQQSLDFATREAGRRVMTGKVPASVTSSAEFKNALICPNLYWGMACDRMILNAYRVSKASDSKTGAGVFSFIDATKKALNPPPSDPKKSSFCLGGAGDYVFIDVGYPFPNFVGSLLSKGASDTMMMRSTTFVFNEPLVPSAGGSC